jgi:hypothetical protein
VGIWQGCTLEKAFQASGSPERYIDSIRKSQEGVQGQALEEKGMQGVWESGETGNPRVGRS